MPRLGTIPIEEVLPFVPIGVEPPSWDGTYQRPNCDDRPKREYLGQVVFMDSLRYQTFVRTGTRCVACGLQAEYFALESQTNDISYHLNLYALQGGVEILFTKDHIIPTSKNGRDKLDNLQTMCSPCNNLKGSNMWTKDHLDVARHIKPLSRLLKRVHKLHNRIDNDLSNLKNQSKIVWAVTNNPYNEVYWTLMQNRQNLKRRKMRVEIMRVNLARMFDLINEYLTAKPNEPLV